MVLYKNKPIRTLLLFWFLFGITVCTQTQAQEKIKVDWRSDKSHLINQGEVIKLLGNVAFYHNGAVITCDTAYRYGEDRMEGVGNVIINTDSTFIYGDRFEYNGLTNIARVFSPLIKTIDKDAILYTHNMEFNTLTNIGTYYGGGTLQQRDNLMESEKGDYYTQTRIIILQGNVQMCNDDYKIKTDSVGFNLNTEFVTFYKDVDIWNHKGEFLQAKRGTYDRHIELYDFFERAYVMTAEQEVWADKMLYNSKDSEATLNNNIQILDTTQQVLSFGDYGKYWSNSKIAELTLNPSVVSYEIGSPDSTFTSADSMILRPALDFKILKTPDTTNYQILSDTIPSLDSLAIMSPANDSLLVADSLPIKDSLATDTLSGNSKQLIKEKKRKEKEKLKEIRRLAKERAREKKADEKKKKKKKQPGFFERLIAPPDTTTTQPADTLGNDSIVSDSLTNTLLKTKKTEPDSSDYVIRGFRNVRIYRDSMQSICDSLALHTMDSTSHMFGSPIVWSNNNQVTADYIILFSEKEQLHRAELYDFPLIVQQVPLDTTCYNQMKGKFMEVFFKNNAVDVVYVDGNAQTLYYKEEKGVIDGLFKAESASMKILFKESRINQIVWYNDITTITYPIDKIPASQPRFLDGFNWEQNKRPTRSEIFNRKVVPSYRDEAIKITLPDFSITTLIQAQKEQLIKEGIWRDRSEPLPFEKTQLINDGL